MKEMRNIPRKTKNKTCAIPATSPPIDPKPTNVANTAKIKKVAGYCNIWMPLEMGMADLNGRGRDLCCCSGAAFWEHVGQPAVEYWVVVETDAAEFVVEAAAGAWAAVPGELLAGAEFADERFLPAGDGPHLAAALSPALPVHQYEERWRLDAIPGVAQSRGYSRLGGPGLRLMA